MSLNQKRKDFQKHYSTLFDDLYRYVIYRVPHRLDAEDIVADTLIRAYERLEQFDDQKGSLEQWVFGIAKREIIDFWRRRKIVLELDEAILLMEATHSNAENKLDSDVMFQKIMNSLPPDIHALFALRYIDGLTYQEIADLTHQRPESVRQFFSRTHKYLKQQFSQYAYV